MQVNPLQRQVVASDIPPEQLAGSTALTEPQKIAEASRQFESILLQQILSESQKTVIPSEFTDSSTASGIYQDMVTHTLADSISKSGSFGLAKIFDQQLAPHAANGRQAMGASRGAAGSLSLTAPGGATISPAAAQAETSPRHAAATQKQPTGRAPAIGSVHPHTVAAGTPATTGWTANHTRRFSATKP